MVAGGDAQRLSAEYEELGEEIQQLQQVKAQIEAQIGGCRDAVESLETIEDGSDVLVPLGGDTRVRATVGSVEEVIVGVGADVSLELERDEALETLEDKIEELEETSGELEAQIESRQERLQQVAQQAQASLGR